MSDPLEQKARDLTKKINDHITKQCENKSHLQWEYIADQAVAMFLNDTPWEHRMMTRIGQPPQVVLTQYRATEYRA